MTVTVSGGRLVDETSETGETGGRFTGRRGTSVSGSVPFDGKVSQLVNPGGNLEGTRLVHPGKDGRSDPNRD